MVNAVVPHADLETARSGVGATDQRQVAAGAADAEVRLQPRSTTGWSASRCSPGEATRLAYMTDEAVEGRDAFLEKRDPDWSPYPHYF